MEVHFNPMKKFLKKQWLNILGLSVSVFILVYFCATNGIGALVQCFTSLNTIWLVAALACLVFYWLFEAGSLHVLIRYIYPKMTFPHSFRLSMIGLFYSALTPFSTGGQPMELYEMTSKYGMNGAYSCSILTRKAIVFQSVATLAGVLAFIFGYGFFRTNVPQFSFITIIGLALNLTFLGALIVLSRSSKLTHKFCGWIVPLLAKCRIIKDPEKTLAKVDAQLRIYHDSSALFSRASKVKTVSSFYAVTEFAFYFLIPYCIYRSFGLVGAQLFMMVYAAAYVTMISAFIPLPGGSGGAEGSFYMLFVLFFTSGTIAPAMLLWRFITYYSCIIAGSVVISTCNKRTKKMTV